MSNYSEPQAILKTLPLQFFREVTKREFIDQFVIKMNEEEGHYWLFPMPGVPKHPVLHLYVVIGNRVRYRANIVEFQPGGVRIFDDGRSLEAKAWMVVSGPVVRAPHRIDRRGFQGFRYTPFLF